MKFNIVEVKMQKLLGKIIHISQAGNIIAKLNHDYIEKATSTSPIRLGTKVSISNMGQVGKVTGVIGPVKSPYIVIKPYKKITENIDRQDVFEYEDKKQIQEIKTRTWTPKKGEIPRKKKGEQNIQKWYPSKSFPNKKKTGK